MKMAATSSNASVLRGELFKAADGNLTKFNLRWFDLYGDGTLQWSEAEGSPPKSAISLIDALISMEPAAWPTEPKAKATELSDAARYGIRITLQTASSKKDGSALILRASSAEERLLWAEAMDSTANPVPVYSHGSAGRTLRITLPATGPLGVDLGSEANTPCVTVCGVHGEVVAAAGLLVGDLILAVNGTVLRNMAIAERVFARVAISRGTITLRLAEWNRELRVIKQAGHSGFELCLAEAPDVAHLQQLPSGSFGSWLLVRSVERDSPAASVGLLPGDHVLAINGHLYGEDPDSAAEAVRRSLREVRLVITGHCVRVPLLKDADGRIGVDLGELGGRSLPSDSWRGSSRARPGVVIMDVMPRSAAQAAGLRNGDLLVSVDGEIVADMRSAYQLLSGAARALSCVVWRPRPDETVDETSGGGTGGEAGSKPGCEGSAGDAEMASSLIGTVPTAYFTHPILGPAGLEDPLSATLGVGKGANLLSLPPANVPLYEDLTLD